MNGNQRLSRTVVKIHANVFTCRLHYEITFLAGQMEAVYLHVNCLVKLSSVYVLKRPFIVSLYDVQGLTL